MLTMLGLSHDRTHALKAPVAWTVKISSAPARVVSSSRARCLGLTSGTPVPHQPRRGWRWGTPDASPAHRKAGTVQEPFPKPSGVLKPSEA